MSPSVACLVDDLEPRSLASERHDVEGCLAHCTAVGAADALHDLSIHQQVNCGVRVTAADEKSDKVALDREGLADKLADRRIAGERVFGGIRRNSRITGRGGMRVDGTITHHASFTDVCRHVLFGDRSLAESRSFNFPAFVSGLLKIIEHNVRADRLCIGRVFRPAYEHDLFTVRADRVAAQQARIISNRVDEHRVFQPSANLNLCLLPAGVFHVVTHHRRGIARVIVVQRTKWRVRIQRHFDWAIRIGVSDSAERIGTREHDILPTLAVERADLFIAIDGDFDRKTLLEW